MDLVFSPAYYPFTDGTVISPTDLNLQFYGDTALTLAGSLSLINGLLDEDNADPDLVVEHHHTQRGTFIEAHVASGTANLDWRYSWFGGFEWPNPWSFDEKDPQKPIPGANRTFFLKWPSRVLVQWTVHWMSGNYESNDWRAGILLVADGDYATAQLRTISQQGTGTYPFAVDPRGYQKARVWSGHALLDMTEGHHDVGCWILADSRINATRVHACSVNVIPIKSI